MSTELYALWRSELQDAVGPDTCSCHLNGKHVKVYTHAFMCMHPVCMHPCACVRVPALFLVNAAACNWAARLLFQHSLTCYVCPLPCQALTDLQSVWLFIIDRNCHSFIHASLVLLEMCISALVPLDKSNIKQGCWYNISSGVLLHTTAKDYMAGTYYHALHALALADATYQPNSLELRCPNIHPRAPPHTPLPTQLSSLYILQVGNSHNGDNGFTEIVVPRPGEEDVPTTTTVSKPLFGKIRCAQLKLLGTQPESSKHFRPIAD